MLKCRAAVAFSPKQPIKICGIIVHPPSTGEVRIKMIHTALCHTDLNTLNGLDAEGRFPCILGHEGVGVVEAIGLNVTTCKVGDVVIPCYQAECFSSDRQKSTCVTCKGFEDGRTNLCGKIRAATGKGVMKIDGGTRFFLESDNSPIFHYMGTSTFSEYTVVHQESVAVINPDCELEHACLLGCGVSTGLGAVRNTAQVKKGSSVAVFGLGTVGLSVIQGSHLAGASTIIGIDTNASKAEVALKFGATHFVSSGDFDEVKKELFRITEDIGVDYSFECVGIPKLMRFALEVTAKGWGLAVIAGVAPSGSEIVTAPFQLITGRRWAGTALGGWQSRTSIPILVNEMMQGGFSTADYITHRFDFNQIHQAFSILEKGECLRCIINVSSKT